MRISVVVASASLGDDLYKLIRSLEEQTLAPYEVLIVVPRSGGELRAFPPLGLNIKVIELERDPGPILARVLGGVAAAGDAVAFIDSDCIAPPSWLASMAREMEEWGVDVVAGSVEGFNIEKFISRAQERSLASPNPKHDYKVVTGDVGLRLIVTANMLLKRHLLFDDEVVPPSYGRFGFEDLDFACRLTRKGYKLLYSPVRVLHRNRASLREVVKRYYEYGRGLPIFRRSVKGCTYARVISALVCSLIALLSTSLACLACGRLALALLALALVLSPLYAFHLTKLNKGGVERLAYPLIDLLLLLASAVGALRTEIELLTKGK